MTQPELVTVRARKAIQRAGGLLGRGAIARGLRPPVSLQRVWRLSRSDGFPEPVARLGDQDIWLRDAVRLWCQHTERNWEDGEMQPLNAAAVAEAGALLRTVGGVVNRGGIARGLQPALSLQTVWVLTRRAAFPEPVAVIDRQPVWLASDVGRWAAAAQRQWTANTASG